MRLSPLKYFPISIIFIHLIILSSCGSKSDYLKENVWYIREATLDVNNKVEMKENIFFEDDSVFSYSYVEKKDYKFPIERIDNKIIIKRIYPTEFNGVSVKKDSLIVDTVYYSLKLVLGHQVLLLTKKDQEYLIVLKPEKPIKNFIEKNSDIKMNEFKVGGISIGDTINVDELEYSESKYYGFEKNILKASMERNNDIKLELINKNIVYGIKQENIKKESINSIKEVIDNKLGASPDTIEMSEDSYTEGYKWTKYDMLIELTRMDLSKYFVELAKKTNDYTMKRLYAQMAIDQIKKGENWTLSYDNKLLQNVLQLYSNKTPVSNIIE